MLQQVLRLTLEATTTASAKSLFFSLLVEYIYIYIYVKQYQQAFVQRLDCFVNVVRASDRHLLFFSIYSKVLEVSLDI